MKKNIIIIIAIGAIIIFIFRNRIKNLLGIETEAEVAARHAKEAAAVEAAARRAREAAKAEAAARRAREAAAAEAIEAKYAKDATTEAKHPREARLTSVIANLRNARMSEYNRERLKRRLKRELEYRRGRVARGLNWYSDEEGRRRIGIPTPVTPERARAAAEVARRAREAADREGRRRIGHIRPIPSEKIKVTGGRIVEPPSKEMMEERARRNRIAVEKQERRAREAGKVEAEAKRAIKITKEELKNALDNNDPVRRRAALMRLREAKKAKVEARRARQNAEAFARSIGGWVRRPRPLR